MCKILFNVFALFGKKLLLYYMNYNFELYATAEGFTHICLTGTAWAIYDIIEEILVTV